MTKKKKEMIKELESMKKDCEHLWNIVRTRTQSPLKALHLAEARELTEKCRELEMDIFLL